MTDDEAVDALAQIGPLIEALERIMERATTVLLEQKPPKLRVVDHGDPKDWVWENKVYGDD